MASYGLEKRRLDTPIALPRRVLPPVALPLMAPHGQDPFGVPTRFMELTVYLRFPRLHVCLFRNYTYTYLQRYLVALSSVMSRKRGSNPQPSAWQADTLPIVLFLHVLKGRDSNPRTQREWIYSPPRLATSLPFNRGTNEAVSFFILHRG